MNVEQLQENLNRVYSAFTGLPRAYMQIETVDGGSVLIVYKVYALAIEAHKDDPVDYEARLCEEIYDRFMLPLTQEELEDGVATLIWRRRINYTCKSIQAYNETAGEYIDTGRVRHQVSLRCYCPRVDKLWPGHTDARKPVVMLSVD
jgi:hypothetical protein